MARKRRGRKRRSRKRRKRRRRWEIYEAQDGKGKGTRWLGPKKQKLENGQSRKGKKESRRIKISKSEYINFNALYMH